MQLLASLMLDCVRVILQALYVPLQLLVLFLQTTELAIETLRILPLLFVRGKSILPKDHVVPHPQCEQCGSTRSDLSPTRPAPLEHANDYTGLFYRTLRFVRVCRHELKYKLLPQPASSGKPPFINGAYLVHTDCCRPSLNIHPNRLWRSNKLHEARTPCYPSVGGNALFFYLDR